MRISLPSLNSLREIPAGMRDIVKYITDLGTALSSLTANGILMRENISHEIVFVANSKKTQQVVEVEHGLKRVPLFYAINEGSYGNVYNVLMYQHKIVVDMAAGASVKIVLF